MENPPSSLALRENFVKDLFKDCKCDVVIVPTCQFGVVWKKRWTFLTTWAPLLALGARCQHAQHASLLGRAPAVNFKSGASAECPTSDEGLRVGRAPPCCTRATCAWTHGRL